MNRIFRAKGPEASCASWLFILLVFAFIAQLGGGVIGFFIVGSAYTSSAYISLFLLLSLAFVAHYIISFGFLSLVLMEKLPNVPIRAIGWAFLVFLYGVVSYQYLPKGFFLLAYPLLALFGLFFCLRTLRTNKFTNGLFCTLDDGKK